MLINDAPAGYWNKTGIYEVVNTATGRVYIGATTHLSKRRSHHAWQLANGKHYIRQLQRDYDAAGANGFTFRVLEFVTPQPGESKQALSRRMEGLENEAIQRAELIYNIRLHAASNVGLTYSKRKSPQPPRHEKQKGRPSGFRHHSATLTPEQERHIQDLHRQGKSMNVIAQQYGVNRDRISRIIHHPFTT